MTQFFRYLERDISAENLVDIKQKVQDKYRYAFVDFINFTKHLQVL